LGGRGSKENQQKGEAFDRENQSYPALNMIGGRRYIKKRSSLNTKTCELFPLVVSRITIPQQRPCNQPQRKLSTEFNNTTKIIYYYEYYIYYN
jgi:hypothetical protein